MLKQKQYNKAQNFLTWNLPQNKKNEHHEAIILPPPIHNDYKIQSQNDYIENKKLP